MPLVQHLIGLGADTNHANLLGTTLITAATQNGHTGISDMLAQAGASPEMRNF